MSIPISELKALLQKSGNRCAFPNCGELLLQEGSNPEDQVVLSKVAHIVAESLSGPRGQYPLPIDQRNKETNLLLLCGKHHDIIDGMPQLYTVERLRQIKEDHEALVRSATGDAIQERMRGQPPRTNYVHETVFSTLFPVTAMPTYVYNAPCNPPGLREHEVRARLGPPRDKTEFCPYMIRGGRLYTFQNLGYRGGPFRNVVRLDDVQRCLSREWWNDPAKNVWFVTLLNRSLNALADCRSLQWDPYHQRYYFRPDRPGEPKEISYRPLNRALSSKPAVWQPMSRKTQEPRPYWLHRAVNLQFHQISVVQWCLSIRPEFHVTKDGVIPELPKKVGATVTRKKSHMFNYDLLAEVNFWRDFLSGGEPRIILDFGRGQFAVISTSMMQAEIDWPGMPEKYAKSFRNVDYVEDLFTWAKLAGFEADLSDVLDDEDTDDGDDDNDWSDDE